MGRQNFFEFKMGGGGSEGAAKICTFVGQIWHFKLILPRFWVNFIAYLDSKGGGRTVPPCGRLCQVKILEFTRYIMHNSSKAHGSSLENENWP